MRASVLVVLLGLLDCSSRPTFVDLTIEQTTPATLDVARMADATIFVRGRNICPDPVITLAGARYPGPVSVSAGGVLLAGGKLFYDTLARAHPDWRNDCDLSLTAELLVDCSDSSPAFPFHETDSYGSVSFASIKVPLVLHERLDVTPMPQGTDVSPFALPHVVLPAPASMNSNMLEIEGLSLLTTSRQRGDGEVVLWRPTPRFEPGHTYAAVLHGGPFSLRTSDGRCLPDEVRWSFTVRAADEPPFRSWWEKRDGKWFVVWDDLGGARYALETKRIGGESSGENALPPESLDLEAWADDVCFRLSATTLDDTKLQGDWLCPGDRP